MSKQNNYLPKQIVLNGADYFLLQLDHMMMQSSSKSNVCSFAVELQAVLEFDDLEQSLLANPVYQWASQLRFKKGLPFSLSKWVVDTGDNLAKIGQHQLEENETIPENLLAQRINVKKQSPFKIDLLQRPNTRSILLFTWHHALMDAHGGEAFIRYLGSNQPSKKPQLFNVNQTGLALKQRADIAQTMKNHMHEISQLPLLSLYTNKTPNPVLRYRLLSFTAPQTQLIDQKAQRYGAGFLRSHFYLAASLCAIAYIQLQRAPLEGDILIPVPLDRRRKGVEGPVIGNQVSFLFYRIPKHAALDLTQCVNELVRQMKDLMLSDKPEHGLVMMDFMRRVPGALYRLLLKGPTAGLMASFFYSDTGDLFNDCHRLFGQPIKGAVHYPPNMYPPGITFVFSRFRGRLQVTLGYMEQVISNDEVDQLCSRLQSNLIDENSP